MLKVLAGDLSATFNIDGQHGQRYLARKAGIAESLCEQLMLHDQILIPTSDYLTAAALVALLGERTFIDLLEADRLKFVRLRMLFGYLRGENKEGSIVALGDPENRRPQDSPIEESIYAALSSIQPGVKESEKLAQLIAANSHPMEMAQVIAAVKDSAYADFRHSSLWHASYVGRTGSFKLPGSKKHTVTMLGPTTDSSSKPIDALLALTLSNIELYVSNQFSCVSMSTGSPMGDCLDLKSGYSGKKDHPGRHRLWSFLDVASVPNLAAVTLADQSKFSDVLKLTDSRNARVFREWFHQNATLTDTEMKARYVDLLHEVPWAQTAPIKALRFAVTTLLDAKIPSLGKVASLADTFLLDKVLKGNSAKFFVDDLRTFSGKIGIRK